MCRRACLLRLHQSDCMQFPLTLRSRPCTSRRRQGKVVVVKTRTSLTCWCPAGVVLSGCGQAAAVVSWIFDFRRAHAGTRARCLNAVSFLRLLCFLKKQVRAELQVERRARANFESACDRRGTASAHDRSNQHNVTQPTRYGQKSIVIWASLASNASCCLCNLLHRRHQNILVRYGSRG